MKSGPGSSVSIATGYGLDGPGNECRWWRGFPHLTRPALWPTQPPVQWVLLYNTSTPPMGRTVCTEPQCLYKGAPLPYLYIYEEGVGALPRNIRTNRLSFLYNFNRLNNAELNTICHLLALLGTHHILHVGRIRVKYQDSFNGATHAAKF